MFYQQNWHWFDNSQFTFNSQSDNGWSGAPSNRVKSQSKIHNAMHYIDKSEITIMTCVNKNQQGEASNNYK